MKLPKSIDDLYLADLSHRIRTLPPDEAACTLLECGSLVLLAGYPEIAYQLFTELLDGELKISKESSLAHVLKSIVPSLCYLLKIDCPAIFEEKAMSIGDLEWYVEQKFDVYEQIENSDRFFSFPFPASDWSEDFIREITHPTIDGEGYERFGIYNFINDLDRIISVDCLGKGNLAKAAQILKIFEAVTKAWNIGYEAYDRILIFGIRTYMGLNDEKNADRYIVKWWKSSESVFGSLSLMACFPALMQRIAAGVLQSDIKISHTQAQELVRSIDKRTYNPQQIGFIPTVEDWNEFLEHWNDRIFELIDKEDEEEIEWYEDFYPEVMTYKQCLRTGATETQIVKLEQKLHVEFPLAYRNFLLASNGFVIANRRCEIYGTDRIDWFINENSDLVDAWNNDNDEIGDEQYFQYGEHQDCCWIRTRYMKTALQISSTEDGDVYLLNPLIVDRRNEWEAWDFGNKNPGAYRYRSFWEMMQSVYNKSFEL
ncbi:SMI1/KNR4 family protein [Chamaesiphon sp. VAR_48_metabat_403]|uniref:SMI1/KNR4 family protein n=1 Tax=Chamaesiphon sp. VAR_48_metabat_403 TaxID=2964700 RepID=UPI00286DFE81|nr:SMI1/KNR4 family protein [Chamaesiphon sp. VAR_48_metabat_403]